MIQIIYKKLFIICVLFTVVILTACITENTNQDTSASTEQTTRATGQPASSQITQNDPVDQQACNKNEDCVLVEEGCCPCSSGGNEIAIHRSLVENHNTEREKECAPSGNNIMCPTVYLCGQKRAECSNSQCKTVNTNPLR